MPPPKIFQAFRRSSSRGGSTAAVPAMEPHPYHYGSLGRIDEHAAASATPYRRDQVFNERSREQGAAYPSSRSHHPADDDYYEDGYHVPAGRVHPEVPIPIESSETSETRVPRVQRMEDPHHQPYERLSEDYEDDDDEAHTVSDGYVEIPRPPREAHYHGNSSPHMDFNGTEQMRPRAPSHYPITDTGMRHASQAMASEATAPRYMSPGAPHLPPQSIQNSAAYQQPMAASPVSHGYQQSRRSHRPKEEYGYPVDRGAEREVRYERERSAPRNEYVEPRSRSHHRSNGRLEDTYYIIPGNRPVIFQDEHGNEIARVGDFSGRKTSHRSTPFVIQDEQGRELYRTGNSGHPPREKYSTNGHTRDEFSDRRSDSSRHSSNTSGSSPRPHYSDHIGHGSHRYPETGSDRSSSSESRELPVRLVDQWGHEIEPRVETFSRHGSSENSTRHTRKSRPSKTPNIILVDDYGRQIPISPQANMYDPGTDGNTYRPAENDHVDERAYR